MKVVIDDKSGFCFGVINAIKKAEEGLDATEKLYCLGDIVHNNREIERLNNAGLTTITYGQYYQLGNCNVLIRAHGEPPEIYQHARDNNIRLIDATCPVVLKLQERVRKGFDEISNINGQVVIYGRKGHAEVNSLNGQINRQAIIIEEHTDIEQIDFQRPILLFSQTTKSIDGFRKLVEAITKRTNAPVKVHDTICRQVSNRMPQIREFATQYDVILFVSGQQSSNGQLLYRVCREANPDSHFISSPEEIQPEWFVNKQSAGICGATSTPRWLMGKVAKEVEKKWSREE